MNRTGRLQQLASKWREECGAINNVQQDLELALLERCALEPTAYYQREHEESLYLGMRALYTYSCGLSALLINETISGIRPVPRPSPVMHGLLARNEIDNINIELQHSGGYATYLSKKAADLATELRDMLDHKSERSISKESARTFISDWEELKTAEVVRLMCKDETIRQVANNYLGCESVLNLVCAWKTEYRQRNGHNINSDAMAFHFDCDHNRFLKVFLYLDDVSLKRGPHVFVPRTSAAHRQYLPAPLQRDGRISSLQVINNVLDPQIITGRKGTIIFADTHNLHRGTPVHAGESRYILQLQFVDSVFGARAAHPAEHVMDMNLLRY